VTIGPLTYNVVFWIEPRSLDDPSLFCLSAVDFIKVGVEIGPADNASATGFSMADVTFDLCEFGEALGAAPVPATGVVTPGPPLTIEWTDEDELSYSGEFVSSCVAPGCGSISLTVSIATLDDGAGGAATDLLLTLCDGSENCCDCCCDCDLSDASITDLDITDGGTRYRLFGGPYSLANGPFESCTWIIGIQVHGSGTAAGTIAINYCDEGGGWRLQGFNTTDWITSGSPGQCTGQIDVTKVGATGFITIEGGRPCPEFE